MWRLWFITEALHRLLRKSYQATEAETRKQKQSNKGSFPQHYRKCHQLLRRNQCAWTVDLTLNSVSDFWFDRGTDVEIELRCASSVAAKAAYKVWKHIFGYCVISEFVKPTNHKTQELFKQVSTQHFVCKCPEIHKNSSRKKYKFLCRFVKEDLKEPLVFGPELRSCTDPSFCYFGNMQPFTGGK